MISENFMVCMIELVDSLVYVRLFSSVVVVAE